MHLTWLLKRQHLVVEVRCHPAAAEVARQEVVAEVRYLEVVVQRHIHPVNAHI